MSSAMIVTEPLDEATWEQLGWEQAETLLDGRHLYAYLQRTPDGRIAIGGRGAPRTASARRPTARVRSRRRTVGELRARLVELFPSLRRRRRGRRLARRARRAARLASRRRPRPRDRACAWAGGYVGEGVAAANLAGRTLPDLIRGAQPS